MTANRFQITSISENNGKLYFAKTLGLKLLSFGEVTAQELKGASVLSLPTGKSILRKKTFPFSAEKHLGNILFNEAQKQISLAGKELLISFESQKCANSLEVLWLAYPKDETQVLENKIGKKFKQAISSPVALSYAASHYFPHENYSLLLHLENSKLEILHFEKETLASASSISEKQAPLILEALLKDLKEGSSIILSGAFEGLEKFCKGFPLLYFPDNSCSYIRAIGSALAVSSQSPLSFSLKEKNLSLEKPSPLILSFFLLSLSFSIAFPTLLQETNEEGLSPSFAFLKEVKEKLSDEELLSLKFENMNGKIRADFAFSKIENKAVKEKKQSLERKGRKFSFRKKKEQSLLKLEQNGA